MKEKLTLKQERVGPGGYPEFVRVKDEENDRENEQTASEYLAESGDETEPSPDEIEKYGNKVVKDTPEIIELDKKQVADLRKTLALVGVLAMAPTQDSNSQAETNFESESEISGETVEDQSGPTFEEFESLEKDFEFDDFERKTIPYSAQMLLNKDEVLFLDENDQPVGEPEPFQDFIIDRPARPDTPPDQIKPDGTVSYRMPPGKMNHFGIPEEGLAGEWLKHMQEQVQAEHPEAKIKNSLNVVLDFKKASEEKGEPKLVAKIESGEIDSYLDIVKHFADKPMEGAEEYTREQYVRNAMDFGSYNEEEKTGLPPVLENELRNLMPGLCAVESKFNNGVVSKTGARGFLQIQPETWEEQGGQPDEYLSLVKQVEVAGKYFQALFWRLKAHVGEDKMQQLQARFDDEESFQRDLITPLVFNSYITGASGMSEVVNSYVDEVPVEEWPTGKELFLAIADHGKAAKDTKNLRAYGNESHKYVPAIYGQAKVLNQQVSKDSLFAAKN